MSDLKSYSINENTYNQNPGVSVNTTRTLKAPNYQTIFKSIDSENHELLINQVNSNNNEYNNAKSNLANSVFALGTVALMNYMHSNGIDNVSLDLVRRFLELFVPILTWASVTATVTIIISSIMKLIKKKEVVQEGNKFVEDNYPEESKKCR